MAFFTRAYAAMPAQTNAQKWRFRRRRRRKETRENLWNIAENLGGTGRDTKISKHNFSFSLSNKNVMIHVRLYFPIWCRVKLMTVKKNKDSEMGGGRGWKNEQNPKFRPPFFYACEKVPFLYSSQTIKQYRLFFRGRNDFFFTPSETGINTPTYIHIHTYTCIHTTQRGMKRVANERRKKNRNDEKRKTEEFTWFSDLMALNQSTLGKWSHTGKMRKLIPLFDWSTHTRSNAKCKI